MKKSILFLILGLGFLSTSLSGQLRFGGGSQLILDGTNFGLQGRVMHDINDSWRGSGTFTYYFNEFIDWSIDADVHYTALDLSNNFSINPLGGLRYVNTSSSGAFGFNIGLFLEAKIDDRIFYAEPKFIFREGTDFAIAAGIIF